MTNEELENKITQTRNRITVETKIFLALLRMYKKSKDKHTLQQYENRIQEQTESLQFLKNELEKLMVASENEANSNSLNSNQKVGGMVGFSENKESGKTDNNEKSENMVAFDFLYPQESLSTEKIAYRIKKINKKLDVENKFKNGAEKAMEVICSRKIPENSTQYIETSAKVKENEYKILCLSNALKRYKGLYLGPPIDLTIPEKEKVKNNTNSSISSSEQKLVKGISRLHPSQNGKLQIRIISAKKLHTFSDDKELTVVVSVNGHQFVNTSSNKFGRWNESFEVSADRNAEIEIMVKEDRTSVVGLFWFRPSELQEAEKLKKIELRNDNKLNDDEIQQYTLSLEPAGEIKVKMNYVYDKMKPNDVQTGIQRRKAAHKLIINKLGHKLVTTQSYNIFKCAACGDFILSGSGLQCLECRFVCHNRCAQIIIAKCITKVTNDHNEDKNSENIIISNYNIPHMFNTASNLTPAWCCHCGLVLPIGKNQISKCVECGKVCHKECKVLLPNLCGMSKEMAKSYISAIEKAEQEKRRIKVEALRKHHTILVASTSVKAPKRKIKPPTLDDFHFISVLGRGSFGKVMLAEEKTTKKLYAIKMLKKQYIVDNDEVHSMMSEKSVFLTVSSINHPFLVNLHSCFTSPSRIYFVMEYAQGGDLIYHVRQNNFNQNRAKFYLCEVLLALEYLHKKNIIYRDLKLDNILLTVEGHIKITDYGLCKENMDVSTTTNTFCGTPEFMAPELIRGHPYTRAVDWWTYGILTYEMLVRGAPFKGDDDEELFRNILENQPYYPPQLMSREAIQLTSMLLSKDPKRRLGSSPADAKEVMNHSFFRNVDWKAMLEKRVPVPYVPRFKGKLDISHFDDEFTNESTQLSPVQGTLKPNEQELFRGFTYINHFMDEEMNKDEKMN